MVFQVAIKRPKTNVQIDLLTCEFRFSVVILFFFFYLIIFIIQDPLQFEAKAKLNRELTKQNIPLTKQNKPCLPTESIEIIKNLEYKHKLNHKNVQLQTKEHLIKIKNEVNTNNRAKLRYMQLKQQRLKQIAESKKSSIKKFNANRASIGKDNNFIEIIEDKVKEVLNTETIEKESPKKSDIKPKAKSTNKYKTDELKEDKEKNPKNEDNFCGKEVPPEDEINKVDSANYIVYPVLENATAQEVVDYFSRYT